MEKYGVEMDEEKTKTAGSSSKCPKCGRDIPQREPPFCRNCGTEPWEKQPEKKP